MMWWLRKTILSQNPEIHLEILESLESYFFLIVLEPNGDHHEVLHELKVLQWEIGQTEVADCLMSVLNEPAAIKHIGWKVNFLFWVDAVVIKKIVFGVEWIVEDVFPVFHPYLLVGYFLDVIGYGERDCPWKHCFAFRFTNAQSFGRNLGYSLILKVLVVFQLVDEFFGYLSCG